MSRDPFPFVLDELQPIRPVVKRMFGFTYVYLGETLLCALRDSEKKPATNGLWLFTTTEHVDSLAENFLICQGGISGAPARRPGWSSQRAWSTSRSTLLRLAS